jgi:replicative DNA helicase
VSDKFNSLFHKVFKPEFFMNPDYKTLAGVVFDFYEEYNKPPGRLILSYVERQKIAFADAEAFESIRRTLFAANDSMTDAVEKYSSEFMIDDALSFIQARALYNCAENICELVESDNEEAAVDAYRSLIIPEVRRRRIVTFEKDIDVIADSFNLESDLVIQFKGDIGKVAGPLRRGDFFFWMAPTGLGKTWALMWTAVQCRNAGLNVLFISLEMPERSLLRRFSQMYFRRSIDGESADFTRFVENGDTYKIVTGKKTYKKIEEADIRELHNKFVGIYPHGRLKIVCPPGASVQDVRALLSELRETQQFVPDVICIDYADKMAAGRKTSDYRESLGLIWRDLRDLSLELNNLVVTASQTNKDVWRSHFTGAGVAEDSRKLNEASSAVGIMADAWDRANNLVMLRSLKMRDGWNEFRDLYASQCLNIGRPFMQTIWADKLDRDSGEAAPVESRKKKRYQEKDDKGSYG